MTKRIPLVALQKALYAALINNQLTPVYDDVPEGATLPYITIGAFTAKPTGTKVIDKSDTSISIHIWSEYNGKMEVNEIANNIVGVIDMVKLDLSEDNFNCMSQEYDMFESFPEESGGYHGVITLIAKIQNKL